MTNKFKLINMPLAKLVEIGARMRRLAKDHRAKGERRLAKSFDEAAEAYEASAKQKRRSRRAPSADRA